MRRRVPHGSWALTRACLAVAPLVLPLQAHAAEGFFDDKLPAAVRTIWPSVFAFVCEGKGTRYVASAFIVKKTQQADTTDYDFITAGHAAEDCRQPRRYLVENIGGPRYESDGITRARQPRRLENVKVVYVDEAYDIAIVRVSTPSRVNIGKPLPITGNCDQALHRRVYAVGFPGVGQRRSTSKLRETKRWSSGTYVGLGRAEFRAAEEIYIAATVDSLPGSSGGPVVDEAGTLIGIIAKGAAAPENGFRYDVDPNKPGDWQTFLVPCQAVLRILQRSAIGSLPPG